MESDGSWEPITSPTKQQVVWSRKGVVWCETIGCWSVDMKLTRSGQGHSPLGKVPLRDGVTLMPPECGVGGGGGPREEYWEVDLCRGSVADVLQGTCLNITGVTWPPEGAAASSTGAPLGWAPDDITAGGNVFWVAGDLSKETE